MEITPQHNVLYLQWYYFYRGFLNWNMKRIKSHNSLHTVCIIPFLASVLGFGENRAFTVKLHHLWTYRPLWICHKNIKKMLNLDHHVLRPCCAKITNKTKNLDKYFSTTNVQSSIPKVRMQNTANSVLPFVMKWKSQSYRTKFFTAHELRYWNHDSNQRKFT